MSAIATARTTGKNGPPIIFVHGVGSTAAIWDYQLLAFGNDYRCFAIELRGNGVPKPEARPETITREGFVDDVLAVADATGDDTFHFVGCSLGGVVGFEVWKRAPQRLRSLTFVGSFAWYPNAKQYADGVVATVRQAGTMETFARARVEKLGLPSGPRTDETIDQMACKSVDSYIASTYATWTGDYRSILPTISVPTLVLHGEHDTVAPASFSQEIAAAIPGAQLHQLPNAGHVANADTPVAFNAILREFLTSR